MFPVNYNYFVKCSEKNLVNYSYFGSYPRSETLDSKEPVYGLVRPN